MTKKIRTKQELIDYLCDKDEENKFLMKNFGYIPDPDKVIDFDDIKYPEMRKKMKQLLKELD